MAVARTSTFEAARKRENHNNNNNMCVLLISNCITIISIICGSFVVILLHFAISLFTPPSSSSSSFLLLQLLHLISFHRRHVFSSLSQLGNALHRLALLALKRLQCCATHYHYYYYNTIWLIGMFPCFPICSLARMCYGYGQLGACRHCSGGTTNVIATRHERATITTTIIHQTIKDPHEHPM